MRVEDKEAALAVSRKGRGGLGLQGVRRRIADVFGRAAREAPAAAFAHDMIVPPIMATSEGGIFERRILSRKPLRRWASAKGRVVLLGDAAHGMHPCLSQGASMAFEDAVVLAECLADLAGDEGVLDVAGDESRPTADRRKARRAIRRSAAAYVRRRRARANAVQRWAHLVGSQPMGAKKSQGVSAASAMQPSSPWRKWLVTFPAEGGPPMGVGPPRGARGGGMGWLRFLRRPRR